MIELLVVVAVIGVLTATILPALSKAKQRGIQAHCMSNLKQIGIALQLYVNDNEDSLPGGVWSGAMPSYDKNSSQELIYYLADYLDAQEPKTVSPNKPVVADVFVCPGYQRYAPDMLTMRGRKCWVLNDNVNSDPDPAKRVPPFGYPESDGPPPVAMLPPLKMSELDSFVTLSDTFAMRDADWFSINPSKTDWAALTPNKPVHGRVHNELYFDWHVAAKPVNW